MPRRGCQHDYAVSFSYLHQVAVRLHCPSTTFTFYITMRRFEFVNYSPQSSNSPSTVPPQFSSAASPSPLGRRATRADRVNDASPASNSREYTPRRTVPQKIDHVLETIQKAGFTLGEFLVYLFSSPIEVRNDDLTEVLATYKRSDKQRRTVVALMSGQSSYTAAHVVQEMYKNKDGRPSSDHSDAAAYFSSTLAALDIKYARPSLSTWALNLVSGKIIKESNYLQSEKAGLRVRASRKVNHASTPMASDSSTVSMAHKRRACSS